MISHPHAFPPPNHFRQCGSSEWSQLSVTVCDIASLSAFHDGLELRAKQPSSRRRLSVFDLGRGFNLRHLWGSQMLVASAVCKTAISTIFVIGPRRKRIMWGRRERVLLDMITSRFHIYIIKGHRGKSLSLSFFLAYRPNVRENSIAENEMTELEKKEENDAEVLRHGEDDNTILGVLKFSNMRKKSFILFYSW